MPFAPFCTEKGAFCTFCVIGKDLENAYDIRRMSSCYVANYAKGLSIALNIPFIGINHLEGHLYASIISNQNISYPYLCFLVTGGHTQIWEVQSVGNYILHSALLNL